MTHGDGGGGTGLAIVQAFCDGDAPAMTARLADGATFRSPVTEYRGRERVAEVLAALVHVLTDVRLTRTLEDAESTAAFFTATGGGRSGDGVLLVRAAAGAPATELTLMLRPLGTLLAGIERMKVLLGREPAD
jgi:hypothetical protein